MAAKVRDRKLSAEVTDGVGFDQQVARGVHVRWNDLTVHANPGLVKSLVQAPPTWLLLGGGWPNPTVWALVAAMRRTATTTILWAEANPASRQHRSGPLAKLRRAVIEGVDAFAVPGRLAQGELCSTSQRASEKPVLVLPNVVDEQLYSGRVDDLRHDRQNIRARYGLEKAELVMLWPARLIERYKGVLRFLEVSLRELPPSTAVVIAGDGPDRPQLERWLAENGHSSVRLLGHVQPSALLELYAIADVLVLPSLSDANPLTAIEALWAGLPILISDRCGNFPEVVENGQNGWVVDPFSPGSVTHALRDLLKRSPEQLRAMGERSRRIAQDRFDTSRTVGIFVDQLESLPHRSRHRTLENNGVPRPSGDGSHAGGKMSGGR